MLYLAGVAFVAVLLVYEQSLVSDDDLSQVKKAFDLNGYVGIVYFADRRRWRSTSDDTRHLVHGGTRQDARSHRGMFDAIAPRYDLLNHLLSAGIDRRWRKRAIASLRLTGRETLLDVCTGTADVALEADAARARVVGVDFAGAMLALGLRKVRAAGERRRIVLVRGDAMRLPARDRQRRCGHRRVRHPQRAAAGGGVRRDGAGAAARRPAGDSRVRRAAHSRA